MLIRRKLGESEAQNNTLREELKQLQLEMEQLKLAKTKAGGEYMKSFGGAQIGH